MAERVRVCETSELEPGTGMMAEAGSKRIAVFNVDGEFHAIEGECTHEGGPLGEGELAGATVTCPWHGARFDVTTGDVLGLPATRPEGTFPVSVEDGEVYVEV